MESAPNENLEESLEGDARAELDATLYRAHMQALLLAKAYPGNGELEEIASGLQALRQKTWLSRPVAP